MNPQGILAELEHDCAPEVGRAFLDLVTGYFSETRDRRTRVSTDKAPSALAARFAEPLPRRGRPVAAILERLRTEVIPDCNHLFHPRYIGHQVSAPLPIAVWTEPLTAALNNSLAVWEMSPVGTVMEHQVVAWLCELAGYGTESGGTLTTGGTEATFTALLAARAAVCPDAWSRGVGERPPLLICGEHAHYAIARAAGELGIGTDNVRTIASRDYCLDPERLVDALELARREGRTVMAVVATAGSTATGSFDDLERIGLECEARGIWLHVDAAHGGGALFSSTRRTLLRGLARSRSIAFDPHKMMLLPLQCGTVLVRDAGDLDRAFAQRAPYLFHDRDDVRTWDLGVRSFLCSRRADVLKLWVALQRHGADGIGTLFDSLCDTTRELYEIVNRHEAFTPLHEPACNILCFRYEGAGHRDRAASATERPRIGDGGRPENADADLDELNRLLRERYNRSGEGWITATVLNGRPVLRATIMNPRTTSDDVRAVLDGLAALAVEMHAAS